MLDFITLNNLNKFELIKDTVIRPLKINKDETGILVETLRVDWSDVYGDKQPFAMQYYSETKSSVARDEKLWHFHPGGQQDRFEVITGSIVVAIGDIREDSPTKGLLNLFYMDSVIDPYLIVIPKRTLHAFMVTSKTPAVLLNFPTRLYDLKEEMRIPFSEANMKVSNGKLFNWNLVRLELGHKKLE